MSSAVFAIFFSAIRPSHVDREYARKQPGPRMPRRRLAGLELEAVGLDIRQQPQLSWFGRLGRSARDDLLPMFGVSREHAVITQHVKAARRDQGHQPGDQIEGVEDHGMGAVPPDPMSPPAGWASGWDRDDNRIQLPHSARFRSREALATELSFRL
jgi:hypothetical protein